MLHVVRDAISKARKLDRVALAQDFKAVYGGGNRTGGERGAGEITRALGKDLFLGCRSLGGQGLRSVGVPATSQAHPQVLVHHESAGAGEQ